MESLPDPASLEPGSDISAFMAKGVDDALRRRALKSLFQDPRFNVMDRMDVYIDDYSIPDPMPPEWLDKLEQVSHLGDRAARDREAEARLAAGGDLVPKEAAEAGANGAPGEQQPSLGDAGAVGPEPVAPSGGAAARRAATDPPPASDESAPQSIAPS